MGVLLDGFNKIAEQSLELIKIRDRKIELQAKEIALLKKLLAGFQNGPRCDSGQDKYPVAEKDRAELETEGYPHYDELIRRP
jgi:hypothetical protein